MAEPIIPTDPANPTPPAPAAPAPAPEAFDPKVLENPELWKTPRMQELLKSNQELKSLKEAQEKAANDKLLEEKKYEELVTKREQENSTLKSQMQTLQIDNSLTAALAKESTVDIAAALKLVDRTKLSVDDAGKVSGLEEAVATLKTDSPYLFTNSGTPAQPKVGSPSNPGNPNPGAPAKYKASQFEGAAGSAFYRANKAEVDAAYAAGLVEDDVKR